MTKRWKKQKTLAQLFSRQFCEINQNTIFEECLWAAATTTRFCGKVPPAIVPQTIVFAFQINFAYHSENYDFMKFHYDSTNLWLWPLSLI